MNKSIILSTIAALLLIDAGTAAVAYEEPSYSVIEQNAAFEIRRYDEYIVAEVDVDGSRRKAGNAAFRILAGYIFGDNQTRSRMEMTVPVESRPEAASEKMQMTVPVESVSSGDETHTYSFVMERKYSLDTLPKPNDPRIRIVERPARTVAVRRFGGFWSDANYEENTALLHDELRRAGLQPVGLPAYAYYNGPLTPWFLRRNEIIVELAGEPPSADQAQEQADLVTSSAEIPR